MSAPAPGLCPKCAAANQRQIAPRWTYCPRCSLSYDHDRHIAYDSQMRAVSRRDGTDELVAT